MVNELTILVSTGFVNRDYILKEILVPAAILEPWAIEGKLTKYEFVCVDPVQSVVKNVPESVVNLQYDETLAMSKVMSSGIVI